MTTIKRFKIRSVAKVLAVLFAFTGFINAVIYTIIFLFGGRSRIGGIVIYAMLFVLLPLVYALIGLVTGFILAFLYNFIAGKFGGVQIELENYELTAAKKQSEVNNT